MHLIIAAVLACFTVGVAAESKSGERQSQRPLIIGVDHPAVPQVTGKKFRTPETLDSVLAQQLAAQLKRSMTIVQNHADHSSTNANHRDVDIQIVNVSETDPTPHAVPLISVGLVTAPMAIMRSDTKLTEWKQLKGRSVCVSKDGRYVGVIAREFGAIESVYLSAADALLALRTGHCDAAVHDDILLNELIKLPEWKKFAARLPPHSYSSLSFAVMKGNSSLVAALKRIVSDWKKTAFLNQQLKLMVRNIAFEVYLSQDVPDCH